jgi:RNA polymerase sigma factor (TIGR02999 family)
VSESPERSEDADITVYLHAARDGGEAARDVLFTAVYGHLRRMARRRLSPRDSPSLDATGLVHEAYLRLAGGNMDWRDREHFFAAAARAMRHIVIDRLRRRRAIKRGAGAEADSLSEPQIAVDPRIEDVLALDELLTRLRDVDPRLVRIVELCVFAGLTSDEAGEVLGVSGRTVKREWRKARALLQALTASQAR